MTRPFFSHKLLRTAPDGTYQVFNGAKRVTAHSDRLEVGSVQIPYDRLLDLRVQGKHLHLTYVTPDGMNAEEYLRYEAFLPGKAQKALIDLQAYVQQARARVAPAEPGRFPSVPPLASRTVRYAEILDATPDKFRVAVYSARASFPAMCPVCARPAATVTRLRGSWFIPVCLQHTRLDGAMSIEAWTQPVPKLIFSLPNSTYAAAFVVLNECPPDDRCNPEATLTPLHDSIARGVRFVLYQFAIGALHVAVISTSGLYVIEPEHSRWVPGLRWTAVSLLLGWWAFPSGPIFTGRAVLTNQRGGIDVTEQILAILDGRAVSASGV